jgi:uncharacterized protein (DUF1330 family)
VLFFNCSISGRGGGDGYEAKILWFGTVRGRIGILGIGCCSMRPGGLPTARSSWRECARAAAVFKQLGGKYLVRTLEITAIDGATPKRFVIIAFDSAEKAKAWNVSDDQVACIRRTRHVRLRSLIEISAGDNAENAKGAMTQTGHTGPSLAA